MIIGLLGCAAGVALLQHGPPRAAMAQAGATEARVVPVLTPEVSTNEAYARARAKVQIVMYSARWCGICTQARSYFNRQRLRFMEHDVERDPSARKRHRRLSPSGALPTIELDELVLQGFSEPAFEKRLGEATLARLRQPRSRGPKTFEVHWQESGR